MVDESAHVMTDTATVLKFTGTVRTHSQVNHAAKEYVRKENGVKISKGLTQDEHRAINFAAEHGSINVGQFQRLTGRSWKSAMRTLKRLSDADIFTPIHKKNAERDPEAHFRLKESLRPKEWEIAMTNRTLSLHPLKFDEAITDLLKIKPMPKPPKKHKATPEASKSKLGNRGAYAKQGKPKGSGFNARTPKPKR